MCRLLGRVHHSTLPAACQSEAQAGCEQKNWLLPHVLPLKSSEERGQASCPVHLPTSYPTSRLHWIVLKKGWDLSLLVPPPPAPRRRWGSNCSSCGERVNQHSAALPHLGGRHPPPGAAITKILGCSFLAKPVSKPLPHDFGGS